jgi:molecular chaperone GrpE
MSRKKDKSKKQKDHNGQDIPVHVNHDDEPDQTPEPVEGELVEEQPADELQALRAERDDLKARLQRLAADYQNYQKRQAKESAQGRQFANEALMKELLGVLDDMERAIEAAGANHAEDDALLVGTKMVHDKFLSVLKQFGLHAFDPTGEPFDPQRHAALMQQPSDEVEPMTVLQTLQTGYELNGRPIRPAQVIVSTRPADESEES